MHKKRKKAKRNENKTHQSNFISRYIFHLPIVDGLLFAKCQYIFIDFMCFLHCLRDWEWAKVFAVQDALVRMWAELCTFLMTSVFVQHRWHCQNQTIRITMVISDGIAFLPHSNWCHPLAAQIHHIVAMPPHLYYWLRSTLDTQ